MLKNKSNSDVQYLLGNLPELTEEALQAMPLLDGVPIKEYCAALVAGQQCEELELTIQEGNEAGSWMDSEGNPLLLPVLQLLCDCETRWLSTFLMLDCMLMLLMVHTL